jgi:thioredoxin-related protein
MHKSKGSAVKLLVMCFSLLILATAAFLMYGIADKKRIIDDRKTFTSLEITLPGNHIQNIHSDNHNLHFIIIFFDPDCYYCHVEIEDLLDHIDYLAGIKIYLLTTNEFDAIGEFEKQHKLTDHPQIITGRITGQIMSNIYGIKTVPSLMIYDENGALLFSHSGYTPITQILKILGITPAENPEVSL